MTVSHHVVPNLETRPFAIDPNQLGLAKSGGEPLPDAVRTQMEAMLGMDFSDVRVHIGPQAERIGAIAFAIGSDIYFSPGHFQPETIQGKRLLGHELAHVMQQRQGRVRTPGGSDVWVVQDGELEAEADRLGHLAAGDLRPRGPLPLRNQSPASCQRAIQPYIALDSTIKDTSQPIDQPGTNYARELLAGLYDAFNTRVKGPWRFSSDLRIARASDSKTVYVADDPSNVRVANFVLNKAQSGLHDALSVTCDNKTLTYHHVAVDATLEADCGHVAKKVMGVIAGLNPSVQDNAGSWTVTAQRLTLNGNSFGSEERRFASPDAAFYTAQGTRDQFRQWLQADPQRLQQGPYPVDEYSNPGVGQSYVIMPNPTDLGHQDVWNWHWGAVVAAAGSDRLTLEGYAGVVNATGKNWYFEMYSTNLAAPGQTFHRRNAQTGITQHFGPSPMTFVASNIQR